MTNDLTSAGKTADAPRVVRRAGLATGITALGLTFGLTLAGCAPSGEGMYIEGWWDNGDPFYAPSRTVLFDFEGNPTCEYPVKYLGFESRSNPLSLARAVSFEIMNPDLDPDTSYYDPNEFPTEKDRAKEYQRRERAQGSLDLLWEYTHPQLDAALGIEGPEDLQSIKDELKDELYGLGKDAPYVDYLEVSKTYFVSSIGTFDVVRTYDVEEYLDEHDIPLRFKGLEFEYYTISSDEGEEYLLVKEKATGTTDLWQGDQKSELTDAVWFSVVEVKTALDTPSGEAPAVAEFTFQSDGCPDQGGVAYQRFFLRSYTLLEPGTEEESEPEPSPSPSA